MNHRFYFNGMSPDCHGLERGALHRKMSEKFHKFFENLNELTDAAMSVFGSGYAWLVYDGKKLKITTTKNQDTPLCRGFIPILNIDVLGNTCILPKALQRPQSLYRGFCKSSKLGNGRKTTLQPEKLLTFLCGEC